MNNSDGGCEAEIPMNEELEEVNNFQYLKATLSSCNPKSTSGMQQRQ